MDENHEWQPQAPLFSCVSRGYFMVLTAGFRLQDYRFQAASRCSSALSGRQTSALGHGEGHQMICQRLGLRQASRPLGLLAPRPWGKTKGGSWCKLQIANRISLRTPKRSAKPLVSSNDFRDPQIKGPGLARSYGWSPGSPLRSPSSKHVPSWQRVRKDLRSWA